MNGNDEKLKRKVVFCIPTYPIRPCQPTVDSLRDEVPIIEEAGWEHALSAEIGNPYISCARAVMLRKALNAKATHIVFIDHDVSWKKGDLLKLLETEGGIVAGTYRFKNDDEIYMGSINSGPSGTPLFRPSDGALDAEAAPAGFLKVERWAVNLLMRKFPELCYGEECAPHFDLFNHGAYKGRWWGEDYACTRRWLEIGEKVWIVPNLSLTHWDGQKPYHGNFHQFLRRQPGGDLSDNPITPLERLRGVKHG